MLSNLEYTENTAVNLTKSITKAYKKGRLMDQVINEAMEIQKDSRGKPTKIIYTVGGPFVYLDLFYEPGSIVVQFHRHTVKKKLPNRILEQIEFELEGLCYD